MTGPAETRRLDDLVWYVAYGSNLSPSRLGAYLRGGAVSGAHHDEVGSRDPTPPRDKRGIRIAHRLTFARRSTRWDGGGVAFVDREPSMAETLAAAYLVSRTQFLDIYAQENRAALVDDVAPSALPAPGDTAELLDTGWYRTILGLAPIDGRPALTFTHPHGAQGPHRVARSYLAVIADGLAHHHGLDPVAAAHYLSSAPGVGWTEAELAEGL